MPMACAYNSARVSGQNRMRVMSSLNVKSEEKRRGGGLISGWVNFVAGFFTGPDIYSQGKTQNAKARAGTIDLFMNAGEMH